MGQTEDTTGSIGGGSNNHLDSVDDIPEMRALLEVELKDNDECYVRSEQNDYYYNASAISGDYAPSDQTGGTGFWVAQLSQAGPHSDSHVDGSDDIQIATNAQKGLATSAHIVSIEYLTSKVDQDITSGSSPTLDGANITGVGNASDNNDSIVTGASTKEALETLEADIVTLISGNSNIPGIDTSTSGLGNITLSGEQTLNGLSTATSSILVTNNTLPEENGIWVSDSGAWSRRDDYNTDAEVNNGDIIHVIYSGSNKYLYKYLLVTPDPITLGTSGLNFEEHAKIDMATTTTAGISELATDGENAANVVVQGNDSRNSNERTPVDNSATNDKLADMAANTAKVNATGSAADPADLAFSVSTIFARLATGNIVAATVNQIRTLLGVRVRLAESFLEGITDGPSSTEDDPDDAEIIPEMTVTFTQNANDDEFVIDFGGDFGSNKKSDVGGYCALFIDGVIVPSTVRGDYMYNQENYVGNLDFHYRGSMGDTNEHTADVRYWTTDQQIIAIGVARNMDFEMYHQY